MNEVRVLSDGGFEIQSPAGRKAAFHGDYCAVMLQKYEVIKARNPQAADYYLEGICDSLMHRVIHGSDVAFSREGS
jgi:hypothetical protein